MKRIFRRSLSSLVPRGDGVTGHPPLNLPFPGAAHPPTSSTIPEFASKEAEISAIKNGMRVATVPNSGGMCSVGVVLEAGARNERLHKDGVSHFAEKLSFSSTRKYPSPDSLVSTLEPFGGMFESLHFRDVSVFTVSCLADGVDTATEVLSEVLMRGRITEEEIEGAREAIACELDMYTMGADQEPIITDLVHAAAYNNNTVGYPKICPVSTLPHICRADVLDYYQKNYLPTRMTLVGVGVEQDTLIKSASQHFPSVSSSGASDTSSAVYTGGHCYRHDDTAPPSIGPQELPTLTHLAIGFESCSHQHPDYVKFCVLNTLMGGGGSFSAGGPGKGMYTRLYLQVLNMYHWMYSALALNHPYQDTGLFTINASSHPNHGWDLVQVLIRQFKELARGQVNHSELQRAKTQLKSTLLMNLEYRSIVLEDIGRQVCSSGERKTAPELCAMIDSVTPEEMQTICRRMLESTPSVGAFGDLKNVPPYEEIVAAFGRDNGELTNRISHFLLRGVKNRTSSGIIKSASKNQ